LFLEGGAEQEVRRLSFAIDTWRGDESYDCHSLVATTCGRGFPWVPISVVGCFLGFVGVVFCFVFRRYLFFPRNKDLSPLN